MVMGLWHQYPMAKNPFLVVVTVALSVSAFAQTPVEPAATPAIDIEERKASVATMETYISQREKRLTELGQDIVTLDARIEKRVDELVKMLADMRDSKDSRTKVSNIKQEAIEGLRRGIDLYSAKRREMVERAKKGDEAVLGDLGKFDERIFKRVDQIVELGKSFPTHKDVDKYESDGGSYWNGYYYEHTRISDDWKQNRRDNMKSGQTRDEITKAIREGLERLDQRRRSLKDLLDNRNPSKAARDLYIQEIGGIDAQVEKLNSELVDITSSTGAGTSRAPGLDEAVDIGNMLDDARKDLRGDVSNLFRLYDQFAAGRAKLNELKENLAARKAWLEKNAPAAN
jgi:chromosome segregation ATPase